MQVVEAPVGRVGGYPRLEPALVVPEPPAVGSEAPVVVARVGSTLNARVVRYSGKGILRFNCKIFKFIIYSIFLHGVFYSSSSPNCGSVKKIRPFFNRNSKFDDCCRCKPNAKQIKWPNSLHKCTTYSELSL